MESQILWFISKMLFEKTKFQFNLEERMQLDTLTDSSTVLKMKAPIVDGDKVMEGI